LHVAFNILYICLYRQVMQAATRYHMKPQKCIYLQHRYRWGYTWNM